MEKLIRVPVWIINYKTLFKRSDRYYAYALGRNFNIFDSFVNSPLTDKSALFEKIKNDFNIRLSGEVGRIYDNAYEDKHVTIFPEGRELSEWNNFSMEPRELWYLLQYDAYAFNNISRFLPGRLTYNVFRRVVTVDFIELDVSFFENQYTEMLDSKQAQENKKLESIERKIAAGILCPECFSKSTLVIQYSSAKNTNSIISCRDCGNTWSVEPFNKKNNFI